ncbi:coproporphyrinogen III oxidase [Rhodospirillaceae bacterium KN72]|uniref:Heme chaperone HemW n=1 Tax=Pacificispira spongiicola TaxID=2729598 RepID=A0A7Y0E0P1_9PROT|nr:radical SAM family heme chaperone HemW [Pacificispira spongiicola]NMM45056.1 coproporphyrinogen III oxidase [Pacificispira spongiicola]
MASSSASPLALYVHWPFCKAKCPYCDFNSHVRDGIDQARWRTALLAELDAALVGFEDRTLTSIFFGGGTPSLMDPETTAALIDRATARVAPAQDIEITLEANPTSVEAGRFRDYRDAGVNRVSLGIQALDDESLRFLGREHSAAEAMTAIDLARENFPRMSFDLIYARKGQTPEAWAAELEQAIGLAADHLSLYQLTIESGTRFYTRSQLGETLTADEEVGAALYDATQERLEALGLPAYEVSNHARPGAESRHNLAYWRYWDYVGIGPGAHGRETRDGAKRATTRQRLPERWIEAVERDGHGLNEVEAVDADRQYREILLMGLRLSDGVPEDRLIRATGRGFEALDADRLQNLIDEDYAVLADGALAMTPAGRLRLNAVLGYLLA